MATDIAVSVPLKALANELGVASPQKYPVQIGRSSSPPPLMDDTSGILEDGEVEEKQNAVGSLHGRVSPC